LHLDEMLLADRSAEVTQEEEDCRSNAPEVGEANPIAGRADEGRIRRRFSDVWCGDAVHSRGNPRMRCAITLR